MAYAISLENRRALVTGASSGLGPAIAAALDNAGASVVVHYHQNREGAETLASSLGNASAIVQADLGNASQIDVMFNEAAPVDILVNCAAVESQDISDLTDMDFERWQHTMSANVSAPFLLMKKFANQGKAGSVVNISSIEGSRPAPGHGHYSTSKAALEMLTRAAALEFGAMGIRVTAIAPGLIWRDGIEEGWPEGVNTWKERAPLGNLVDPTHIAEAVVFLASDASGSTSGSVLTIDCGLSARPGW